MPRASRSTAKATAAVDEVAEARDATCSPSTPKRKRKAATAVTITTVVEATSVMVQIDGVGASNGAAKKTKRVVKSNKIVVTAEPPSEGLLLRAKLIKEILDQLFPDPPMPLDHCNNFTLLAAVLLSAQTTDGKVCLKKTCADVHACYYWS
jgi:hypothetical protein